MKLSEYEKTTIQEKEPYKIQANKQTHINPEAHMFGNMFAGSYRFDKGSQSRTGAYAHLASALGTSCLLNSDFWEKKNVSF